MKQIIFFLGSALLFLSISCKKKDKTEEPTAPTSTTGSNPQPEKVNYQGDFFVEQSYFSDQPAIKTVVKGYLNDDTGNHINYGKVYINGTQLAHDNGKHEYYNSDSIIFVGSVITWSTEGQSSVSPTLITSPKIPDQLICHDLDGFKPVSKKSSITFTHNAIQCDSIIYALRDPFVSDNGTYYITKRLIGSNTSITFNSDDMKNIEVNNYKSVEVSIKAINYSFQTVKRGSGSGDRNWRFISQTKVYNSIKVTQ